MKTDRKNCIFLRNLESGEPAYYCGSGDDSALMYRINNVLKTEIESFKENGIGVLQLEEHYLTLKEVVNLIDDGEAVWPD